MLFRSLLSRGTHGEKLYQYQCLPAVLLFTSIRVNRRVELERRLQADVNMPDERKQKQLLNLGKKESTFLRLRRTRLGLDDFRTVKVIGKGAFGEVC